MNLRIAGAIPAYQAAPSVGTVARGALLDPADQGLVLLRGQTLVVGEVPDARIGVTNLYTSP